MLPVREGLSDLFVIQELARDHGLPDISARAIAEDARGFIWIGTFDGLARYDGRRVRTYRLRDEPALVENAFVSLLFDRQQRLLAGGMHSLRRRDDGGWRQIPLPPDVPPEVITTMALLADGTVCAATLGAILRVEDDGRAARIPAPERPAEDSSGWRVATDRDRVLHAYCDSLLARRDGERWTTVVECTEPGGPRVRGAARSPRGGMWCVTGRRALRMAGGACVEERAVPNELGDDVTKVLEDSTGALWIGSFFSGLARVPEFGPPQLALRADGPQHSSIRALVESADGVIHVGTGDGGMISYVPRRVRSRTFGGVFSQESAISCVVSTPDRRVLAATIAGALYSVERDRDVLLAKADQGLEPAQITSLLQRGDGAIFIGTELQGLFRLRGERLEPVLTAAQSGRHVSSLCEDGDRMAFASTRGLVRLAPEAASPLATLEADADPVGGANDLLRDGDGTFWIAGAAGLARCRDRLVEPVPIELDGEIRERPPVRTVARLAGDDVILAIGGDRPAVAVGRVPAPGEALRARTVLSDVEVSKILPAGDAVWLNGEDAIRRYLARDLAGWSRGSAGQPVALRLDRHDGAISPASYGREASRAVLDADGRAWFATPLGLEWVDTRTVAPLSRAPDVVLDQCIVRGVPQRLDPAASTVAIPAGDAPVRLVFCTPGVRCEPRVGLAYRVLGAETWSDVDADRTLEFPKLAPGLHRFELRARNADGIWSAAPLTIALDVEPTFWQTKWAQVLRAALLSLAVLAGAWLATLGARARARRRLDAATRLAEARARADLLLDATDELVCFADAGGAITALNAAGRQLLAFGDKEPLGRPLAQLIAPEARAGFELAMLPAARECGRWTGETRLQSATGRAIPVMGVLLVHRSTGGSIEFLSLVARDLSDRIALEGQLREAQKLEAIGMLAGGVAHDFNNVLTAILGHAEIAGVGLQALAGEPRAAGVADSIEQIVRASERARELIRSLLRFSRRSEPRRTAIPLRPVVEEACRLAQVGLPPDVELAAEYADDGVAAAIDPTELHQIVLNLCSNAAHALEVRGGRISVRLARTVVTEAEAGRVEGLRPGNFALLTVQDDGAGMPEAVRARAFEPFFTTKPAGVGTGLGLATVRGIVRASAGSIALASAVNAGTRVDIWIPAAALERPAQSGGAYQIPRGAGERVLVVDDDLAVLALGKRALEQLGYQVTAVPRPLEALALVEAMPDSYQAVLSDYAMPECNGIELARRLRAVDPSLPVILVTACLHGALPSELRSFGISALLEKPYTQRALADALATALRERR